jgi:glycosyltransferase involved in cell wall biosynthesis
MFSSKDVTLYVPCYNADKTIGRCLEGIMKQTQRPSRIILIDDGSNPPLSAPEYPDLEIFRQARNMGLSTGRNKALSLCETPLIASLDADVVPEPEWLEKLIDAMNKENVVGVGGRLDEFYQGNLGDKWRAVHMAQHWGEEPLINPRFLYGANNIFKSEVLRSVGGYHDSLRTNYEDMLLCERLYDKRFNLFYEPAAKCSHLRRDTEETILRGFWQWYHAKGVINGDFDSLEGLLNRMEAVNFGIYRYRFDMDANAARRDLLTIDIKIPWVFCAMDLKKAKEIGKIKEIPEFEDSPETFFNGQKNLNKYSLRFFECLNKFHWEEDKKLLEKKP